MSQNGEISRKSIDRSERPGRIGLLLVLAGLLVGAAVAVSVVSAERAQPLILGLLAILAMTGVFFLFAYAIGALQFAGQNTRNDLTKVLSDSAAEGLVVVEDDGRVAYANESYLAFSSATSAADLRVVERLFTGAPEVSEAIYRLAQASREGRQASEEIRLSPSLTVGRDFGWYRVRVRPIPRPNGRNATLWSVHDVTHERERQENVFQELQHAIDYLDHAPAGFLSVDPDGAIVYMNATLASWLDHDLARVGSGGLALRDVLGASMVSMLTGLAGEPGEVRTEVIDLDMRKRNGQSLPVRLHHRIAFGQDRRPGASRTLVLNRSPGEEGAEGQRAAEVRFARFFNSTPLAIATLDRGGRILRANPAFVRVFGILPRASAAGDGPSVLDLVAEIARPSLEAGLRAARDDRGEVAPLDVLLAAAGGRSARVWLGPVPEGEGEGESAVLYALDTTEQRQLEQQFAQAQKMQAVGQFAGGVAHDFNNLLQAIIGYSDLLLTNHRPTDPAFQDIMQIKQNANRAAGLVRQLLAFSRRQTLRPEILDLGDVLTDLSMLLRRLLGEHVELDMKLGRDLWQVKADLNQFEQVVVNLAVNARDAMPDGGTLMIRTSNVDEDEARRLALAGMPPADYVRLDVSDTGTGIPPDVMDKIFEPFFTTKEVGKGTGLGLSTVFGIVKQSGAFIYVDSIVGQGTSFSIYVPRHVPTAEELAEESAAEQAMTAAGQGAAQGGSPAGGKSQGGLRAEDVDMTGQGVILLVEDEDPVRAVNGRWLTTRGYTVLEAASGVEALKIIEERGKTVDLVVSDVVMPEMDGPTLLRELRRRYPDLKVIFVSGYAEDAFKKNLPEGEDFNFLAKPFSLRQLLEAVKQVIGR